jgi:predicted MPP superfamily phosphohydrolase
MIKEPHMSEIPIKHQSMNRRSFIKKYSKMVIGLLASGTIMGSYSYKFERFWYQVKEVELKIKNLPKAFEGWRIVQFSDVHLGFHYGVEDFRRVVEIINGLEPDVIFFTGDLIEVGNKQPDEAIPLLRELTSKGGGKWAVMGNHDYFTKDDVFRAFHRANFTVLDNSHDYIEIHNQRLYIVGLDDMMYGEPNMDKAIDGLTKQDCVLLLAHEPDIADESSKYPVSAQFSGHSHGGQIQIPFYGPILKQELAHNYPDGSYYVGERKMPLYVNRGIGTTGLAFRLFCRPEITLFRITS